MLRSRELEKLFIRKTLKKDIQKKIIGYFLKKQHLYKSSCFNYGLNISPARKLLYTISSREGSQIE